MEWNKVTLDKLCDFKNGLWKGKKGPFIHVGIIRNTNFTKGGLLDDSDIAYLDVEEKQYKTRKLEFGDLILEKSGGGPKQPVGRVIPFEKTNGEFSFSNFTSIIRIRDKTLLEYSYLHKFLHYLYTTGATEQMQRQSTGIRNLQLKEYKLIDVPFPSILEQKRIVSILDTVFADLEQVRAKTEQNLKNARDLFDSYLQQVFSQKGDGWVEAELFDHIKFIDYRGKTPKKTERGLRLITAKNVRMGYLKTNPEEFVSPESYDGWMTRGIPKKGDVLFTSEAPLANVAQLDTDDKVVFAQRIITMQPDRSVINCDFLKYLLMSPPIQQRIYDKGTGATVTGIKASLLKKIVIEFPSNINEQEEYAIKLNSLTAHIKKLESIYQHKLASIDELKKSILQKAFSGELTATTS